MLFVKVETGQHKCVRKIVNDDNVEQYIWDLQFRLRLQRDLRGKGRKQMKFSVQELIIFPAAQEGKISNSFQATIW